jgi:hypothetical protein
MRIYALLSSVLLFTTVVLCQSTTRPKHAPVPDGEAAIARAEAVLIPIYGKKQIEGERPFTASLKGDVWTVWGTLHCPDGKGGLTTDCLGGVAVVKIAKGNGRILHMEHGK